MNRLSRRSVLSGCVGAGALGVFPREVFAAPGDGATTLTRFNCASPQGRAQLRTYALAVSKLMSLSQTDPGDPRSWLFQWYTHGVPQPWQAPIDQSYKQQQLARIYAGHAGPHRDLATAMWDTCTHYGQPEAFFLPWHRMYVLSFEAIIRSVSGDPGFTLPYWDYTDPAHHALPAEFLKPADPVFGSLYRSQRRKAVNEGHAIDSGRKPSFLNLNDMSFTDYLGAPGGTGGFCENLDQNLHGNVHDHVGDKPPAVDLGMAFVPTAANDPIFWMHHCNIDRIWASWDKAGGTNPDDSGFLQQSFVFAAPDGTPIKRPVSAVLDTGSIGYVYDAYLSRPAGSPPFPNRSALFALAPSVAATPQAQSGPVTLGSTPTAVQLKPPPTVRRSSTGGGDLLSAPANPPPGSGEVYLSLRDVRVQQQPGVAYDVFVSFEEGGPSSYVGTLNFFGAVSHGMASMEGRTASFRITDLVKARRTAGQAVSAPIVHLVPDGPLAAGATPTIGSITVVTR